MKVWKVYDNDNNDDNDDNNDDHGQVLIRKAHLSLGSGELTKHFIFQAWTNITIDQNTSFKLKINCQIRFKGKILSKTRKLHLVISL